MRRSDTLRENMYYSAVRLKDGKVIRVSRSVKSMLATVLDLLPAMIVTAVALLIFAYWLSYRTSRDLIRPINSLNLDEPLKNDVYEELTPLLQRIDEQNKQKDALVSMRQEFSANVSHELKTPLTSISGYAEIIRDGIVKKKDIPDFSNRIYKEANRLLNLVNDIIKISKLDENEIGIDKEECDLYEMSDDVIKRLNQKAREYNVHVSLVGEHIKIIGYRQVLDEMIHNVIENAIKYNRENGSVHVTLRREQEEITLTVEDTGVGIPADALSNIFKRFFRVDKARSRQAGGAGLGLSIVHEMVERNFGTITVTSEENKGSCFMVMFPYFGVEEDAADAENV